MEIKKKEMSGLGQLVLFVGSVLFMIVLAYFVMQDPYRDFTHDINKPVSMASPLDKQLQDDMHQFQISQLEKELGYKYKIKRMFVPTGQVRYYYSSEPGKMNYYDPYKRVWYQQKTIQIQKKDYRN